MINNEAIIIYKNVLNIYWIIEEKKKKFSRAQEYDNFFAEFYSDEIIISVIIRSKQF